MPFLIIAAVEKELEYYKKKMTKNEVVPGTLVGHFQGLEKPRCDVTNLEHITKSHKRASSRTTSLCEQSCLAHLSAEIVLAPNAEKVLRNKPQMEISAWGHINTSQ